MPILTNKMRLSPIFFHLCLIPANLMVSIQQNNYYSYGIKKYFSYVLNISHWCYSIRIRWLWNGRDRDWSKWNYFNDICKSSRHNRPKYRQFNVSHCCQMLPWGYFFYFIKFCIFKLLCNLCHLSSNLIFYIHKYS